MGDAVHLDDGKMSGQVIAADDDQFTVRITNAAVNGSRLRAAKGINLPDTVQQEELPGAPLRSWPLAARVSPGDHDLATP